MNGHTLMMRTPCPGMCSHVDCHRIGCACGYGWDNTAEGERLAIEHVYRDPPREGFIGFRRDWEVALDV